MTRSKPGIRRAAVAAVAALLFWSAGYEDVQASQTFVSFNGRFYFSYPDSWRQIDFNTANYFLAQSGVDVNTVKYEVVLAPIDTVPFYSREYLFLTVDTIGAMTQARIDSVLGDLSESFGSEVARLPLGSDAASLAVDQPTYDKATQTVVILSNIMNEGIVDKKSVSIQKFYEHGVANFFFYAPEPRWQELLPQFQSMVQSFVSGSIEEALPKAEVKIADVKPSDTQTPVSTGPLLWGIAAAAVAAIAVLLMRRSRSQSDRQQRMRQS